jgi:MoxR-like ATPase
MAPTEALSGTLPLRESSRALIGRDSAMRRLHLAIQKRESQLIWGASGTGKTFLIGQLLSGLSDADRPQMPLFAHR